MTRAAALALAASILVPVSALALHRQTPALVQITPPSGAGAVANPSAAGFRYVVFDSDADMIGNGNMTRQVFLFDLRVRNRTGYHAIEQLSTGAGDAQRGTTDRRGRRVAYDALDGGGVRQIFVHDRRKETTTAITAGTATSRNASIDDVGRALVFESEADFFATGVGGWQIYLVELRMADPSCPFPCPATNNRGLTQITNKAGTSHDAVTSQGGNRIAFESDADLLDLDETGNHVYVRDAFGALSLYSDGAGTAHNATISRNGRQIAFDFDAGDPERQVFVQARLTTPVEPITSSTDADSIQPSVSSGGRLMSFVSSADLLDNGSMGPELFVLNVRRGTVAQVTYGPSTIVSQPAHNAGVFTAFIADGNLLGNGTTGVALYLVNLFELGSQTVP